LRESLFIVALLWKNTENMSTESAGSHIVVPDQEVVRFSPELESYYECLHRLLCHALKIPHSLKTILSLSEQMQNYYYYIRDELESDGGITSQVVDALPLPNTSKVLKTLNAWENSEEGIRQFELRIEPDDGSESIHPVNFWSKLRFTIFEAERALNITRQRRAEISKKVIMRRYPWINEPHLTFGDE
jgi:hypothetical protein